MPSPSGLDLTVVIPTYNERDRLGELISGLFRAAGEHGITLEAVVVDDASPDGTGQLADELAHSYRMTVIHRAGKLGLGAAVIAGITAASADVVAVMDADLSHPPAMVPVMFAAFKATQADLLVGSRYIPGGTAPGWSFKRRLMSVTACLMARPLSPIRDSMSGFFLIRTAIARNVKIKAAGFKIGLELNIRGWPVRLVEMPYRFDDRQAGTSKMTSREATGYLRQLKDLFVFRWLGGARPRRHYRRLSVEEVRQFQNRK